MHIVHARPGLIVLDAAMNLVASNQEAIHILAFPNRPDKMGELSAAISNRVRSQVFNGQVPNGSPIIREFRSGRRTYVCRSFALELATNGHRPPLVVVMERRPSNALALAEAFNRYGLTPREQEVIQYLVQGLTSKEIAERMSISPNTVKAFLRLVMVKMGVSTRSGVIGKIVGSNGS